MPNNIVFSNPGGSVIRWGNGAATPYLTLSGLPSTGTVGVAVSGLVTNTSAAPATWTVSSSPADAIITPSSGTLAPGVAVAFTLTALASGLKNVQLTSTTPNTIISGSPHSFTAASVAPPPPPPAPAASALTLSMASTGTTGAATLVTVTPNAAIGATGAATLSVSGGGTLGTSTLNFTAGSSAAQSTTLTRTTDGTTTLTMTNNMGLSNLGSPASYGSTSAASTGTPQPFTLTSASSGILPFAIGYAMSQGHVPAGQSLSFSGATAKLTVLSTWPDGSARHGIIAGTYTSAGSAVTVTPTVATVTAGTALTGAAVQTAMGSNTAAFDAGAFGSATFSGADFASPFLTHAATDSFIEAIYRKQIGSDAHLVAWLSLRVWSSGAVEALPWIENGYLTVAGPTNKSATYSFTLGGTSRFSAAIDLPARTRTPLVSGSLLSHWLGTDPGVVVKHDAAYLMATKLVPTYRATVSPSAAVVTALPSTFTPLQQGSFSATMGAAGYQPAIGLLPEWDALYLTTTASSVWSAIQRNGYSAGRWGIHYRDENTNRPLRFSQFPNMVAANAGASSTGDYAATASGTAAPAWDIPHHPSVGYMAYLVTGRWFHMETVLFAATYNFAYQPNTTRQTTAGIFRASSGAATTRGAAWALRTLAQAATVVPDADTTIKAELVASLESNINWNHSTYVAQANNPFGFVETYGDNSTGSDGIWTTATWQQDFYTAATGYMLSLNPPVSGTVKTKLTAFFQWKARSIVGRLGPMGGGNWLYRDAAPYTMTLAFSDTVDWVTGTGPWPVSWRKMYDNTYDGVQNPAPGAFAEGDLRGGNFPAATSYWGNLQPAIAYAVEHGVDGAADAYLRMTGASNWATFAANCNADPVWSVRPSTEPTAPAYIASKAVLEWGSIASGQLASVAPAGISGNAYSVTDAWGGGTVRQIGSNFLLHGGGHGDYAGNEVYSLNLSASVPTWARKWGPTPNASVTSTPYYADGNPASAHTYYYMQFDAAADALLRVKGGPGWTLAGTTAEFNRLPWNAANWDANGTLPDVPVGGGVSGPGTCRDPVTGDVFTWDGFYRSRWSKASGTWVLNNDTASAVARSENLMVVDTNRNCIWSFSTYDGSSGARVERWNISDNSLSSVTATGTHAFEQQMGGAYDPVNDCVWYMARDGVLRKFDCTTYACTAPTTTGTAPSAMSVYGHTKGFFGRLQYVESRKALVMQPAWTSPTFFIRTA